MSRGQYEAIIRQYLRGWETVLSSSRFSLRAHAETGKQTTLTGMIIVRIKDGKIVEGWGEHDRLGQLQQLGAISRGEELRGWVKERLSRAT